MKTMIKSLLTGVLITSLLAGCGSPDKTASSSAAGGSDAPASVPASAPASDFDNTRTITVVSREDGSGTRGAFIELFGVQEKKDDGSKIDRTTVEAVIAPKTDVMLQNVAGDPYAIGYVSLGSMNDSVKAMPVDGVTPTAEGVKDGSYKISRPFNIATKGEPTGLAADFIAFIMSAEGQAVVAKSYIAVDDAAPAYAGTKPEGKLVIAGSSSVAPIMEKLIEAYKAINPAAVLELQQSDSTAGMTAALDGTCDIGMASRELKESELAELKGTAIANDGIAVITATGNPTAGLTSEQVKQIFIGEITAWDAVA